MAHILLVEDNPVNARLATVILRRAGHTVEPVPDAVAARRSLEERHPDIILMDLGLPGVDGFALTREIRRRPDTATIPVLAVTSFAMKGDELRAREAGCSGYLTKPIDRLQMLAEVDRLLADAGGLREPTGG